MPRCANGHEQHFGLKCLNCGEELSYKDSMEELLTLPKVEPQYGKIAVITVGYPKVTPRADWLGELTIGPVDVRTANSFQVAGIRGGSWLDFRDRCTQDLRRWLKLVEIEKTLDRFLVLDSTNPLAVLALASIPKLEHTAIVIVAADHDSTPVEQNTSYVTISLALKMGFPLIVLTKTFVRGLFYFTEDSGFATGGDAMTRLFEPLLGAADDLIDLLEKDLRLGIQMHYLSALLAGSKNVYGASSNVFAAQSYDISLGGGTDDSQTFHAIVFSQKDLKGDFEKSFSSYRSKKFKSALSAEFRFRETQSPLYDAIMLFGSKGGAASLQDVTGGYEAIVKSMPELNPDSIS